MRITLKQIGKYVAGCCVALLFVAQTSLAVSHGEHYSDTWLTAKLMTTIALNRHLSLFDINADVRHQTAYLTGTVDSDIERDLAGEVAKSIEGVTNVKNDLVVDKGRSDFARSKRSTDRTFGEVVDDLTVTATIKTRLVANPHLNGFSVHVSTERGVVLLTGTVKTSEARALVEQMARNTPGVVDVNNRVEVTD